MNLKERGKGTEPAGRNEIPDVSFSYAWVSETLSAPNDVSELTAPYIFQQ